MSKRGNLNLSRPSQIPGKEVTATRRRAVLTVRMNVMTIEKKDIQPPEIGIPKGVRITSVSSKGLNIPMKIAKGDTKITFFAIALRGISPTANKKTGEKKQGRSPDSAYSGKENTKR